MDQAEEAHTFLSILIQDLQQLDKNFQHLSLQEIKTEMEDLSQHLKAIPSEFGNYPEEYRQKSPAQIAELAGRNMP